MGCVVSFVNNDDFVLCFSCSKRDGRSEVLRIVSDGIEKSSFIGSVDDITVCSNFITKCFCYSRLTNTRRTCKKHVWDLTLLHKVLKGLLD